MFQPGTRGLQKTAEHSLQPTHGDQDQDHRGVPPKLSRSGYSREQTRQIIEAGIKGYHNKSSRGLVHRRLSTIQEGREIRKILEKSMWYLPKRRSTEEPTDQPSQGWRPSTGRGRGPPNNTFRKPNPF